MATNKKIFNPFLLKSFKNLVQKNKAESSAILKLQDEVDMFIQDIAGKIKGCVLNKIDPVNDSGTITKIFTLNNKKTNNIVCTFKTSNYEDGAIRVEITEPIKKVNNFSHEVFTTNEILVSSDLSLFVIEEKLKAVELESLLQIIPDHLEKKDTEDTIITREKTIQTEEVIQSMKDKETNTDTILEESSTTPQEEVVETLTETLVENQEEVSSSTEEQATLDASEKEPEEVEEEKEEASSTESQPAKPEEKKMKKLSTKAKTIIIATVATVAIAATAVGAYIVGTKKAEENSVKNSNPEYISTESISMLPSETNLMNDEVTQTLVR